MSKTIIGFAVTIASIFALGCDTVPPPREVVVICSSADDAGAPEPFESDVSLEAKNGTSPCARACKNFSTLGCPEAWKLPGGKTCVEICKSNAGLSSFDPECVAAAKSKVEVRKCPVTRCLE